MKFVLYSTKCRLYLLGRTKDRQQWRVLKFARDATDPRELEVSEDPVVYSEREVAALLSSVHDGNLQHGGLKFEVQVKLYDAPGGYALALRRTNLQGWQNGQIDNLSSWHRRPTLWWAALRFWRAATCCW